VYRGIFALSEQENKAESAVFVPYRSKNALSECSDGRQKENHPAEQRCGSAFIQRVEWC